MKNSHIYETLLKQQQGVCALQVSPECLGRQGRLPDRYLTHIDRITSGAYGGKYELGNCQLICLECDWEKEGNRPASQHPQLAAAHRQYKMWQIEYGRMDRKIRAYQGDLSGTTRSPYIDEHTLAELEELKGFFASQTDLHEKRLKKLVRETPEWGGFMKNAPGLKEITAAMLLSRVDIHKANTVSALWRYLGYVPTRGENKVDDYNPGKGTDLKSPLFAALSISLIRKNSPYRERYDAMKKRGLGHGQAVYRLIKLWLSHLWDTWRQYEGLETRLAYVNNHLGHSTIYKAEDFGWPRP